ncbi:hypothetical protein BOW53_10245 [Solemya pervernicosa gill symbiont]|uniref:Uncharacterized protein n=2 Tax=Gammaproteobacteria incertae sedis TaxID=118884 RepID=A0A1T2L3Q6_9GAMM|nr:hypothetical protein [Candidatus Reidiella endopervernicosa]OOZ39748.1 hypothetical protein BOW53_10245 [Solemya pervernicosa gill symbiont]QKQ27901.1 hypothetical protein HUE57_17660 [Candidatus Reidiella endopervernicosa]
MSEAKFKSDPNGLHFAAGALIGGVTGLLLTNFGYGEWNSAVTGLIATCVVGAMKAFRDASHYPQSTALKNGALIAAGGLITPLMLLI